MSSVRVWAILFMIIAASVETCAQRGRSRGEPMPGGRTQGSRQATDRQRSNNRNRHRQGPALVNNQNRQGPVLVNNRNRQGPTPVYQVVQPVPIPTQGGTFRGNVQGQIPGTQPFPEIPLQIKTSKKKCRLASYATIYALLCDCYCAGYCTCRPPGCNCFYSRG